MATITDIRPIDLLWLSCNYNQGMLQTLYNGGDASGVISPFKYTNEKSTSTNLHDVYFQLTVENYADVRFGPYEASNVLINYRLREAQIDEIEARGKEIDEIVVYYSKTNSLVNVEITEGYDDYSHKNHFQLNPGTNLGNFAAMVKFKDGTITDYSINWGLDLINCTYSQYRDSQNQPVDGFPYDFNDDGSVFAAYTWKNGNNDSKGSVAGYYGDWSQSTKFRSSHKAFQSHADALAYLKYGIDNSLDEDGGESGEPAEDRITTLFYASNIYSRSYNASDMERVGASTIYIDIQYAKNDGTVIVDKNRAICGYVNTNNAINDSNHFGNIIWMAAPNTKILEVKQNWINGSASSTTLPSFSSTTGFYGPLIDGNTIYESRYNTNMYIFANRADAEAFLLGGKPTPIAGGTNAGQFNPDKLVGDPTVYNNPTADISADMSSCWILTKSEVDELANILATGLTSQESDENGIIVNTLITTERSFFAHSEPIDAIVDLFWLPFNPREFSNNDYDHIEFVQDTYGVFEALGEAVDSAGQAIKGAYSNPVGSAWLPGGIAVNAVESIQELTGALVSTVGTSSTANKINVGTHHIE